MTTDKQWCTPAAIAWLHTILEERFGQVLNIWLHTNACSICVGLPGEPRFITLALDGKTFARADSNLPCTLWHPCEEGWQSALSGELPAPGAAQLPSPLITKSESGIYIGYDILGLTYWMLSRQEEVDRTDLDSHKRFPATSSHAYKQKYLERPIVDEWLYILEQVLLSQWPCCSFTKHNFSIKVSHDVDQPSLYAFAPWLTIMRMMAGHLFKRRDIVALIEAPYIKLATRSHLLKADPNNTFGWLMDVSEMNNIQSAFYFICGNTNVTYDAEYQLEHPAIRNLMRTIYNRGHEIGLHPSYNTYQDPQALKNEAEKLKRICNEEGIEQAKWGGRMHYLRWKHPSTLHAWEYAALNYDSTLGYADRPGFRCGTCYEYPAFDPVYGVSLKLRIRPLIFMESTLLNSKYHGVQVCQEALALALKLKDACIRVRGVFALLWHNSTFIHSEQRIMYVELLKATS